MERVSILGRAFGLVVSVGGLVAIAGGQAGATPETSPLFVPVAFAIALAGAALAVAHRPRARLLLSFGVILASVALVGLAASADPPGEPVPRSIVVLFAIGCGLALVHTRASALCDGFALVAGVIAAGALVANATGVAGSGDDPLTTAPVAEVVAWLALTAGVLFVNSGPRAGARAGAAPGFRPAVLAGVSTALLSALLFQALSIREDEQLDAMLGVASRQIRGEIAVELRDREHALSLLAAEWEGKFLRLRGLWESDVRLIISRSPGLAGIEWIDAGGAVGWKYPKEMEHAPPRLPAARGRPKPFAQGPRRLSDGRRAFRLLVPVSRNDAGEGWLSGLFIADELFAGIARRLPEGWVVSIRTGDVELHRSPAQDAAWVPGRTTVRTLDTLSGLPLQVTVGAPPERVAARRSRLPATVLLTGLVLSVL
ncbi:MAG TPA: hypothetical protein VKB65_09115, partial [Myxococcota bacterium]|nr:hypothetical protein [Myxococcota bacterium]